MDIAYQVEVENELKTLGSEQLRNERADIAKELKGLQDQISDLAFNNYRTYADAGRTTQDCTKIFTEMSEKLREVSGEVGSLQDDLRNFHNKSSSVERELESIKAATDKSSPLWEMLSLPARMDVCIRSGYYEAAYSLTNYGMMMQQHAMIKNPLIKNIADRLVEARSLLLEELFNKFSGPLDLAASLQVVNNVRKMPYLTPTQLRVSILQHKDIYLEKQLLDFATHPDFALAAIDVYRTCMHDTLVLYLSVFPENETVKKDPSVDPRWEQWPTSGPSSILGQWAGRNISRLLDLIHRTEMKSGVDMASVWSKTMSLAATFGRMGLDFRPVIIKSLTGMVLERFRVAVRQATHRLVTDVKHLSVVSGEIGGSEEQPAVGSAPAPPPEISMWDDVCVYGNDILNALNGLRYSHTPLLLSGVVTALRDSFLSVLSWLSAFHQSPSFPRAVRILCIHLGPFMAQSVRYLFPYSVISRLFGSSISRQQYEAFTDIDMRELAATCDGSDRIEEVLLPLLKKKKVADIDLEAVMRRDDAKFQTPFDAQPTTHVVFEGGEQVPEEVQPGAAEVPPIEMEGLAPSETVSSTPVESAGSTSLQEPVLVGGEQETAPPAEPSVLPHIWSPESEANENVPSKIEQTEVAVSPEEATTPMVDLVPTGANSPHTEVVVESVGANSPPPIIPTTTIADSATVDVPSEGVPEPGKPGEEDWDQEESDWGWEAPAQEDAKGGKKD